MKDLKMGLSVVRREMALTHSDEGEYRVWEKCLECWGEGYETNAFGGSGDPCKICHGYGQVPHIDNPFPRFR